MPEQSEDLRELVIEALKRQKATPHCPMCGNDEFAVLEGFYAAVVQDDLGELKLTGDTVPYVITVCSNCGFMGQHALGALGLMSTLPRTGREKANEPQ